MDFDNLTLRNGLLVSLFSILVVFVVLVVISYLIDLTAFFSRKKTTGEKSQKIADDPGPSPDHPGQDLDAKKLAVIAAAVAACSVDGSRLIIRKIKRPESRMSGWESAGLNDQMRRPL